DGKKIQLTGENIRTDSGSRHLDHAAHLDVGIETFFFPLELILDALDQAENLGDLLRRGKHGNEDAQWAIGGGAHDGAQLGQKQFRFLEAEANSAQSQCGVGAATAAAGNDLLVS